MLEGAAKERTMVAKKEAGKGVHTAYFDPRKIEIVTGLLGRKEARFNPRTLSNPGFGVEEMTSLRVGIQTDGLNHALLVRLDDTTGNPKLVAGERRLRAINQLIEADQEALDSIEQGDKKAERVLCKNPRNGRMEPALVVYGDGGVECKITDERDEREFLRQAIQENTLHEQLTDYELLLQCRKMEEAGFSRAEQAQTMGKSEAWISQSHSLLDTHACVTRAMERGLLTRTAALTFLAVPEDKIEAVLERAIALTYHEAEIKEQQAQGELDKAMDQIQAGESALRLSDFTGNHESARKARRQVARASRNKERAEAKIKAARAGKKKHVTVDTLTKAANDVEGAAENLNKPQSTKQLRLIADEVKELLTKTPDDTVVNPATGQEYQRRDISLVHNVLQWMVNQNHCKHPLDAVLMVDQSSDE